MQVQVHLRARERPLRDNTPAQPNTCENTCTSSPSPGHQHSVWGLCKENGKKSLALPFNFGHGEHARPERINKDGNISGALF